MDSGIERKANRFKSGIIVYYYRSIESPGAVNLTAADFGCHSVTAEQVCLKLAAVVRSAPSAAAARSAAGYGSSSSKRASSQSLTIGPSGIPLFGLYHFEEKVWLPPNYILTFTQSLTPVADSQAATADKEFLFRLRYRLPPASMSVLSASSSTCATVDSLSALRSLDEAAFYYFFAQCRHDFINDRMHDVYGAEIKNEACLGFASLDLVRIAFEENIRDLEKLLSRYSWKDMIPQGVSRQFNFAMRLKIGLKSKLPRSVEEHYCEYEGVRDPLLLTTKSYLKELLEKHVPLYCVETFESASGKKIVVDPYDSKRPGIAIFGHSEEFVRGHSIQDLFAISISDCNLLLNFKSSAPLSLDMNSSAEALSLAALLDGYYRLMVSYHSCLSDQVYSPMVKYWATFKCFGPVRPEWAMQKFKVQNNSKEGTFLIKQRSTSFNEYVIFVQKMGKLMTIVVSYDAERNSYSCSQELQGLFQMHVKDPDFHSMKDLLRYYRNGDNIMFRIGNQIAPLSNDVLSLMICLTKASHEHQQFENEQTSPLSFGKPVLLSIEDLQIRDLLGCGKFTEVYDAVYCQEHVIAKKLNSDKEKTMLQLFHKDLQKAMFWKHPYIVTIFGICLSPFWVVMEKMDLGPLNQFLQRTKGNDIQVSHYIFAAEQLSQALMYLEECGTPHGDIRCKNIVVQYFHKYNDIEIKLAACQFSTWFNRQPLSHECNVSRLPWIAPERYACLDNETAAADVFSFAMTLWEICSKGARPLANIVSLEEVKQFHEAHCSLPLPVPLVQHCRRTDVSEAQVAMVERLRRLIQQNIDIDPLNRMQSPDIVKELRHIRQKFDLRPYEAEQENAINCLEELAGAAREGTGRDHSTELPSYEDAAADLANTTPSNPLLTQRPLPEVPLGKHNIRSQDIILHRNICLGQGHYGEVYKATLCRSDGSKVETAVKRLKTELALSLEENHQKAFIEFQQELKIMTELKHDNIVQVYGKCNYHSGDNPFNNSFLIVMEYVPNGCLRDYLKKNAGVVSATGKLKFAINIAKGMQFLHAKDIIHRDLAARNVLVTAAPDVKISDFGLARCLDEKDYYRCSEHSAIPALWCAPESLEMKKFFKSSDVWSYAVVLWEMYTNGDKPEIPCEKRMLSNGMLTIDGSSLLHALKMDKRLPKPFECDEKVYELMRSCWNCHSPLRPDFSKVIHFLDTLCL